MTDLGSTVRLTADNVDGDGNPLDPAVGPTLTVTLPSGATASPAVVHDGAGSWHADLVTTLAGRHVARWVGTGAGAFAYVEAFTVDAADPGFLFTLEQAKRTLRKMGQSTSGDDETIREYMAAVTPVIEDIVGPILAKPMDEWYDGGGTAIALTTTPVLSVASVTESWGAGGVRTLTNEPLDGTPVGTYGYTVDLVTGILTRRVSGIASPFVGGRRNVHVVYTAGQALKPNWQLAAREQFRFLWQIGQQGNRPGWGEGEEDAEATESGYAVPRRVIELCGAGDKRIPGIA